MIVLECDVGKDRYIKATYGISLKNIAKELSTTYKLIRDVNSAEYTNERSIIFQIETNESPEKLSILKQKIPNSYVFRLGMDTPYIRELSEETFLGVDKYLNFIDTYVKKYSTIVDSKLTFGTISKSIMKFLEDDNYRNKIYHGICLCNITTKQRYHFFRELLSRELYVLFDLRIRNLYKIRELYQTSWLTIGHSMSPHEGIYTRSLKAWRDWIGPCCNTVLIYDDHQTILEHFDGIIPTYQFSNVCSFADCAYNYVCNPNLYVKTLNIQKDWLKKNTIELQLLPLMKDLL